MRGQPGLFDVDDRLSRSSELGDQLEAFARVVDLEMSRAEREAALGYSDRAKGGRPPFDPVMMFKILAIQAYNNLPDDRAEFLIDDRSSFMRFLGLGLGDKAPHCPERFAQTPSGPNLTLRTTTFICLMDQLIEPFEWLSRC